MYRVFAPGVQDVHREQVVGDQHDLALDLVAVSVLVILLDEHPALLAVGITLGRFRTQYLAGIRLVLHLHIDLFRRYLNGILAPQCQWVCDLAPVCTGCAYAGVLGVELSAGVRTFDLPQLGVHPVFVIRVKLRQPDDCLGRFLTLLRYRQQPTPQRLHAILLGVLHVVCKLTAARALLGAIKYLAKLSH